MLKKIKKWINNHLRVMVRAEVEEFKKSLPTEYGRLFYEYRWKEIENDKSILKVVYHLRNNIFINLYKDSYLSSPIFGGQFEKEVIDFIDANLSAGDCFIDIGANIGFFSLITADIVKNNGVVMAFEPTLGTYNKLSENIELNNFKNVIAHNTGLSDFNGISSFNVSLDGHDAFNSFSLPTHGEQYIKQEIKVETLDNYYTTIKSYKNILIKIDVEGWEYSVIKGAEKILRELNPVLILEFNDENTGQSEKKCTDLYALLNEYGYKLYSLHENTLVPQVNQPYFNYQNLVAKKD